MPTLLTEEEKREFIQGLTLMDNEFMCACFEKYPECAQAALRIVIGQPDLRVQTVKTQEYRAHTTGRAVRTDITATDAEGRLFDIEMQSSDDGLLALRASYYLATLRATSLAKGEDFDKLPETYIIFITARDTFRRGDLLYHFQQYDADKGLALGDKAHIIFVNGEQRGDDGDVQRLLHDLFCANPQDMFIPELAHAVRELKTTEEGQKAMSEVAERLLDKWRAKWREEDLAEGRAEGEARGREEGRIENSRDIARQLLRMEGFTPEVVARITSLDVDEVQRLAAQAQ